MTEIEQILDDTGLRYVSDSEKGITREKSGEKFIYLDNKGQKVTDETILERIKKLVLPPAWTTVWIANKANAHLQATGFDAAKRKQYRYHSDWSKRRNETKYFRLLEFGSKLSDFRKNILKDLRRKDMDERKVLAVSVNMMQKTLIRVGNEAYKQLYGSYGLTTLRDRHVKIEENNLKLSFVGKKGVEHEIKLTDKTLARLVKKCRDIPGQELFQYYTSGGERRSIDSGKINRYIREVSSGDFTAKDFRTWSGTLETLRQLASVEYPENENLRKKIVISALDEVSSRLGNTRTVCKKSYVFPALLEAYFDGSLLPFLKKINKTAGSVDSKVLDHDEKVLLNFLRAERNKKRAAA